MEDIENTRAFVDSYWRNQFNYWSDLVSKKYDRKIRVTKIFKSQIAFNLDQKEHIEPMANFE